MISPFNHYSIEKLSNINQLKINSNGVRLNNWEFKIKNVELDNKLLIYHTSEYLDLNYISYFTEILKNNEELTYSAPSDFKNIKTTSKWDILF